MWNFESALGFSVNVIAEGGVGINLNFSLHKRRMQWVVGIMIIGILAVLGRLYYFQVVKFSEYQLDAIRQQTRETSISPNRGTIYDRNMTILASSAAVERVFISPAELNILPKKGAKEGEEYDSDEANEKMRKEKAERLVSEYLSELFGLDYEWVYEKTQKKHRRDETIKNKVEITITNQIRQFAADNRIIGIYFGKETKRVYPHSNLASHVIGFTGAENNGLAGIEAKYNEYLKGVAGKIVTARDAKNNLMSSEYETYIDAQNGSNLVLTIDWSIQKFLEKHLDTAFAESQAAQRVTGIMMDIHTGEILAMSTKPDFDLNDPFKIDEEVMKYINLEYEDSKAVEKEIARLEEKNGRELSQEEKDKEVQRTKLQKLWKNKAISEPYEPGSTFKVITASMALEEKVVNEHDPFNCSGVLHVGGENIKCHKIGGHGSVDFAKGLQESCNPVIMMVAEKISAPTFLKYFSAFGYTEKTGIDLPGESGNSGLYHKEMGSVELATSSFGQTFKVTPIQHLVGLAAVANGGKIVTPHVVKSIIDDSGNIIKNFEPEIKRTVLSAETSQMLARIMAEGVATGGAARNAFVKGYQIAAKTGTSQKRGLHDDPLARIGSCAAFAPADNPQVIILIIVDEPDTSVSSMYGGVIAAPYIAKTLADTLPYLSIEPQYTNEEIEELQVLVKGYSMQKVSVAVEDILSKGLDYVVEGEGEFIRAQIPKQGSRLRKGGKVILYTDDSSPEQNVKNLVTVPDVFNTTAETANKRITDAGLNINIIGASSMNSGAAAYKQEPAAGEQVPKGTIITVEFRHSGTD